MRGKSSPSGYLVLPNVVMVACHSDVDEREIVLVHEAVVVFG